MSNNKLFHKDEIKDDVRKGIVLRDYRRLAIEIFNFYEQLVIKDIPGDTVDDLGIYSYDLLISNGSKLFIKVLL